MSNTRLTSALITRLNNFNVDAQKAQLGTRLDVQEYGGVSAPAAGTLIAKTIVKYSTTPVVGTATYVHDAVTLGSGTTTVTTSITNPDVPRVLTAKGNATMTGNVVATGTDINGTVVTDTIALSNTSEVVGDVVFKTVTQIVFPAKTNGSGDTASVGVGNKIGFPCAIPNTDLVFAKSFYGTADAGTITPGATVSTSFYALAGTLNGTKALELFISV